MTSDDSAQKVERKQTPDQIYDRSASVDTFTVRLNRLEGLAIAGMAVLDTPLNLREPDSVASQVFEQIARDVRAISDELQDAGLVY